MWHLVVAVLLGNQVLETWALPEKFPNYQACMEKLTVFRTTWGPSDNSLHEIGYRCAHEPREA